MVEALDLLPADVPVVLDPVMVAESGGRLLEPDAERSLRERLVPRATVVTPNLMEAAALAGAGAPTPTPGELARAVHALGPRAVVVTGGHREAGGDLFYDGERLVEIPGERHPDGAAHGSGCTHSSALAAQLALGARAARGGPPRHEMAAAAVAARAARDRRTGPGPVDVLGGAPAARRAVGASTAFAPGDTRPHRPWHNRIGRRGGRRSSRHLRLEPRSSSSA